MKPRSWEAKGQRSGLFLVIVVFFVSCLFLLNISFKHVLCFSLFFLGAMLLLGKPKVLTKLGRLVHVLLVGGSPKQWAFRCPKKTHKEGPGNLDMLAGSFAPFQSSNSYINKISVCLKGPCHAGTFSKIYFEDIKASSFHLFIYFLPQANKQTQNRPRVLPGPSPSAHRPSPPSDRPKGRSARSPSL